MHVLGSGGSGGGPAHCCISSLIGNKEIGTRILDSTSSVVSEHCQQCLSEYFEPAVSKLYQQNNARHSLYFISEKAATQPAREALTEVKAKVGDTLNVNRA